MAAMQGGLHRGGARLEDHRMLRPGAGQFGQAAAEVLALNRVVGDRRLLEEHDRGPLGNLQPRSQRPENRQTGHQGIAAVHPEGRTALAIEAGIGFGVEAEEIHARAIHHPLELMAKQDARIGADQHRSAPLSCPRVLQQQLAFPGAAAIQPQHQGIQFRQLGPKSAELGPLALADLGAGINPPDLQHLAAGELAARQFKQVQRRPGSVLPRHLQQIHRGLAEGVETGQGCHLAPLQAAHQRWSAAAWFAGGCLAPSSNGASLSQRLRSSGVSISGAIPSRGTGRVGCTKRLPACRNLAVRMA